MNTILGLFESASTAAILFVVLAFVMFISNMLLRFEKHTASAIIAFVSAVLIVIAFFEINQPISFWLIVLELILLILSIVSSIVIAFISMFITRNERHSDKRRFFKLVLFVHYLSLFCLMAISL